MIQHSIKTNIYIHLVFPGDQRPPYYNPAPMNHPQMGYPVPRQVVPQMYSTMPPMAPYAFYTPGVYFPNMNYRQRAQFPVRSMNMRPPVSNLDATRPSQPPPSKETDATNQAFLDIFKSVQKPVKLSNSGENSENTASKNQVDSSPASRKISVSSQGQNVNGTSIVQNESSLEFAKIFSDIPKPQLATKKVTPQEPIPVQKPTQIQSKTNVQTNVQAHTQQISTLESQPKITKKSSDVDFTTFLKNAVHSEPAQIASCEYGYEIDGMKVYTFDDMLGIKSKMTYDIQKMVQTLSKFRIAIKSQLSVVKSESAWRSMAEMKELGTLSDKIIFDHSILKILNKITAVNFHQNLESFKSIKFTSPELVKDFTKMLFDKVSTEQAWSFVFAEFVMAILKIFKETGENYDQVFRTTLDEYIEKGLVRNMDIENEIISMKKIKSKDYDEIDRIIAETAEKETSYRKVRFGVLLFVIQLFFSGYIEQSRIDRVFSKLNSYEDSFGIEMYCFFLTHIAKKYLSSSTLKPQLLTKIDELDTFLKNHPQIPIKAKFAIMDVVKHKSENFKSLPPRKTIPSPRDSKTSQTSVSTIDESRNSVGDSSRGGRYKSGSLFNFSSRGKNFGHKNNINDARRPDLSALNRNVRGKTSQRARGGTVSRELSHLERYQSFQTISLDKEDENEAPKSSVTESEPKKITIQQRTTDSITSTTDMPDTNQNDDSKQTKRPFNSRKYVSTGDKSTLVDKFDSLDLETPQTSIDISKNDEDIILTENAQTLIGSFHKKESNVSRFVIDLLGHKLSDHMTVFLKEAFKYYAFVSDGHYTWGVLLSELLQRDRELLPIVMTLLKSQLDELSLNALDEPVLWNYFFQFIFPVLSSNSLSFDDLVDIFSQVSEIYEPDQVLIDLFKYSEKRFALYDTAILAKKQMETKFWKRIVNTDNNVIKTILTKMDVLINYNQTPMNWVNIFLDLTFDNQYVADSSKQFYNNSDVALKDLALSLYLHVNFGDKFTNDLISIFAKRTPDHMNRIFGAQSSQKLLRYVADVFIVFQYIPHGTFLF